MTLITAELTSKRWFSSDCETTGQVPGLNRLLSIGTVVLDLDMTVLGVFAANMADIEQMADAPKNMKWWQDHEWAWERTIKNPRHPREVMYAFGDFAQEVTKRFGGQQIPSAWPASFDSSWFTYYAHKFTGENPISFSWECIKSNAAGFFGKFFDEVSKTDFPAEWSENLKMTHVAVEDAFVQGVEKIHLERAIQRLPPHRKGVVFHPDRVTMDLSDVLRPYLKTGIMPAGKTTDTALALP